MSATQVGADAGTGIREFTIGFAAAELDDMRRRIAATRWPERETVDDDSQGVPLAMMQDLARYWATEYDWSRCEAELNALPNFSTEIDGLDIHFIHVRSRHEDALPLIVTHGWPGSIIEQLKIIAPLTDPTAHGGGEADAFHVVIPSLPGYGFSGRPARAGIGPAEIAGLWAKLMAGLGHDRYGAQGGDWGGTVTTALALADAAHLAGIHQNFIFRLPQPPVPTAELTEAERAYLAEVAHWVDVEGGYAHIQGTRPQTLGYGLTDSPVGLAGWITEKFRVWSDCGSLSSS